MFVKICGARTEQDVATCLSVGADAIGFVLTRSVRQVDAETVRQLTRAVPDDVLTVGVFAGIPAAEAGRAAVEAGVRAVQLHGDYPAEAFAELADLPVQLVRATSVKDLTDPNLTTGAFGEDLLLLDSPVAGSGEQWDLARLAGSRPRGRWLLAGGLTPQNVATAIGTARPWGVDVSSGVEAERGVKDPDLIKLFVAAARSAPPTDPDPDPGAQVRATSRR